MDANEREVSSGDVVTLVDSDDQRVGELAKLAAHRMPGHLHRAISVFVYNSAGRMLLQRRAATKYHFAGLWANAACSHPRPDESPLAAGRRRLGEEMGISVNLAPVGTFVYRAEDPVSGLVEHEFDHVLAGVCDDDPRMDLREADAWDWVDPVALADRLQADPAGFAPWLAEALAAFPTLCTPADLELG